MKIGIIGSHGTGKTTYAYQLAYTVKKGTNHNVCVIDEVARGCPFTINEDTVIQAQQWIFHMQCLRELEADSLHDVVICDRTVLDNLAYAKRAGFDSMIDIYLPMALDWVKTYKEIVFMRPSMPLTDDGVRDVDSVFQKAIDTILDEWIQKYSIHVTKEVEDERHGMSKMR